MVIKELEENLAEINARHAKAKNLQEAEAAIDTLKAELAWAHIAEKEAEVLKADSKVQESKEREVMIVEKLEEAMRILRESEEKVGAVETRVNQAARPQELQAQLDALQDKVNMETIELRKAKVCSPSNSCIRRSEFQFTERCKRDRREDQRRAKEPRRDRGGASHGP